jgi:hypothetical protein
MKTHRECFILRSDVSFDSLDFKIFSVFMGEYAFISRCAFFPTLADQSCDLLVQKEKLPY